MNRKIALGKYEDMPGNTYVKFVDPGTMTNERIVLDETRNQMDPTRQLKQKTNINKTDELMNETTDRTSTSSRAKASEYDRNMSDAKGKRPQQSRTGAKERKEEDELLQKITEYTARRTAITER